MAAGDDWWDDDGGSGGGGGSTDGDGDDGSVVGSSGSEANQPTSALNPIAEGVITAIQHWEAKHVH